MHPSLKRGSRGHLTYSDGVRYAPVEERNFSRLTVTRSVAFCDRVVGDLYTTLVPPGAGPVQPCMLARRTNPSLVSSEP